MPYGNGKPPRHPNGGREPDVEVRPKAPKADPPAPPQTASPPAAATDVTKDTIANIALDVLPDAAAAAEFADTWPSLVDLAGSIVIDAAVDEDRFAKEMLGWAASMTKKTRELNAKETKSEGPHPPKASWPPMPGVQEDCQCTSIFDANDLALRGRKFVLTKDYYMPVVFPELMLSSSQKWAFGQKIEYRQEWRHEGFTLGQLVSSMSLLPNEELALEVSSWQRTTNEIENIDDETSKALFANERSRTDEDTVSREAASELGWNVSATGSFSIGPGSASLSAGAYGSSSERSAHNEKTVVEATEKASNEVSLRRAVKLTQTQESGSENRTTRRIRNPNSCHTVTFNFFQVIKLCDVQVRVINDAPLILFPSLFPAKYSDGKVVEIPYWTLESFTSPALFLTRFFEVDRDVSSEIHGFALRVRMDIATDPSSGLKMLAIALVVAVKYLLGLHPPDQAGTLSTFIREYAASAQRTRSESLSRYGKGRGSSAQITTPGVYVDSLLGRCTACESYIEASRYVDVMTQFAQQRTAEAISTQAELEIRRREELLNGHILEPFEAHASSIAPSPSEQEVDDGGLP